jgi:hypothetical protein
LAINLDILNTLIRNQKEAIKYQQVFACIVLIVGILLILVSNLVISKPTQNDAVKWIMGIGGGFISTISAYPINQIINRKERIKAYELLKFKMDEMTETELAKTESLIWNSIEKIM